MGTTFRHERRLLGLRVGGTLTLTEYVPNEKVTLQWHGTERYVIGGLRGTWMLTPEEGGTAITVRSEFDTRVPVFSEVDTRVPVFQPLAARAAMRHSRSSELPVVKAQMEERAHPPRRAP